MALSPSPFATVSKQSVLGALEATGSHDPDVLERERSHLLSVARFAWMTGAALLVAGIVLCFTTVGVLAGVPLLTTASWLMYRGKRNVDAIKAGFAEFVGSSAL